MSKPRPFIRYNQSTSMQDSSDRTTRLKQKTMYAALANNVTNWGEKTNGSIKYLGNYKNKKKNVKYSEPTVTESGCLVNAPSSSSFLDLSKGMYYCHRNDIQRDYTMNLSGKSWQGPFLQIDTGMTPGVSTWFKTGDVLMAKFNAISTPTLFSEVGGNPSIEIEQNLVDPNYDLFYEPCISEDNEPFRNYYKYANTEVYKDTYPYLEAIKKRYLKGFSFPSAVKFNYTEQLSGFKTEAYLTASTDEFGTLTITLTNPGSGYSTPPTATLTADNTNWYGCATCDEEVIGTPSSASIFTYDDCSQVDNSGGLISQKGIGLTSQYPKPIFCNTEFAITVHEPPDSIVGTPFQIYWLWTVTGVSGQWISPQEPFSIDLATLNSQTLVDSSLNNVYFIHVVGDPSIAIKPGYGGRGYSEDTINTPINTNNGAISFVINDVSCNTEVISLALSSIGVLIPFTDLPTIFDEWNYTYNEPPEKMQAHGYGTVNNSLIDINISPLVPGIGYSLKSIGSDDGETVVNLDPQGKIYNGVDLIAYANTLLNASFATNNKGQVTLNNSTGTLSLPCCTFNNSDGFGYSIGLSGTAQRYAKYIEQTCGPYCQETPKLCDKSNADSSNYIHLPCGDDPKWNCCNTKTITTPWPCGDAPAVIKSALKNIGGCFPDGSSSCGNSTPWFQGLNENQMTISCVKTLSESYKDVFFVTDATFLDGTMITFWGIINGDFSEGNIEETYIFALYEA